MSGPLPKDRNKAPSGLQGIEKRLYFVIQEHSTIGDDKVIKKIFSKYAYTPKDKQSDDDSLLQSSRSEKELTEENAYMATEEVLKQWNVDLDSETESRFYTSYFDPTWRRYATKRSTVIGSD